MPSVVEGVDGKVQQIRRTKTNARHERSHRQNLLQHSYRSADEVSYMLYTFWCELDLEVADIPHPHVPHRHPRQVRQSLGKSAVQKEHIQLPVFHGIALLPGWVWVCEG